MEVIYSKSFRETWAKLRAHDLSSVELAVTRYKENRADPSLRDHALKGKMKGLRAFSAGFDLRVIYREEDGFVTILLIDVRTHNQVY